jgi:hypothetical protein
MSKDTLPARLVQYAINLDPGGQARLRRGAKTAVLLMPGLVGLLHDQYGADLDEALLLLRITALLRQVDPRRHPAAMLAEAELSPRRMGRLLTSDPTVMPERLVTVARFLAAKSEATDAAAFYWLMLECRQDRKHTNRAEWARRFAEALPTGTPRKAAP